MKSYLEQAFGRGDVTSARMQAAIREWLNLYYGTQSPGEDAADRLAVLVVSKLCRTVFAEYESRTAEALAPSLQALDAVRVQAMQYALVGGECLLKPVLHGRGFDFVPIRRDCYAPLGRDAHGALTGVGTMEVLRHDGRGYLLLERRTAGADGLTIETRLFELAGEALGREVPLATLPATVQLQPSLLLPGVRGVGLAALRTPLLNCVDGGPDAVAVYAPAAGLMHSAARLEYQMRQEFENGASRVFASEDLLREDGYGRRTLQDDLFIGLPDDPANVGVTVYSPQLRVEQFLARKQDILRSCESLIGFKRGILSEVEAAERTATEITSSEGDYNLTIQELQAMWQNGAGQALELCAALGKVYGMPGLSFDAGKDLTMDWGDGVLFDRTRTWNEYMSMVTSGLLRPELALAWYFDLPHADAAQTVGIVYHTVQFCDYYAPGLTAPEQFHLPVLKIETDCSRQTFTSGGGQLSTRLGAFAESLNAVPDAENKEAPAMNTNAQYAAGIDSGSASTDAVILDRSGKICGWAIVPTGAGAATGARQALEQALTMAGIAESDLGSKVYTGYGREFLGDDGAAVTEITCHGTGAVCLFGDHGTVIDVGGQDTKVIQLKSGRVAKFAMNDKCAAGTGRFLEIMADRLGISQQQMADLARSGEPTKISSMCTVFAESEVISLIGRGEPRENIARGVIDSVVSRVATMAGQAAGAPYYLTGGLCENAFVVERLGELLGSPVTTSPQARFAGAIGAAIRAAALA